ncbi:MAG: hypothetical protein AAGF24_05015 [Cyanobacteria bacterium P01_H01_bin.121]
MLGQAIDPVRIRQARGISHPQQNPKANRMNRLRQAVLWGVFGLLFSLTVTYIYAWILGPGMVPVFKYFLAGSAAIAVVSGLVSYTASK